MPIIPSPANGLYVWKIEESINELYELLDMKEEEYAVWTAIKHDKRKLEWLAARCLIQETGHERPLYFLENGKPFFKNGPQMSLTHCRDYVALLTHPTQSVGLDIQNPDPKLKVISKKYCSDGELKEAAASVNELDYVTLIWSAKEAVFKVFGEKITFRDQMIVRPFELDAKTLTLDFYYRGSGQLVFKLHRHTFAPYYNVVTTHFPL